MALSMVALCTGGRELLTARHRDRHRRRYTGAMPQDAGDEELRTPAEQYGFEVTYHMAGSNVFEMETIREVARAVARDPRVRSVDVPVFNVLSSGDARWRLTRCRGACFVKTPRAGPGGTLDAVDVPGLVPGQPHVFHRPGKFALSRFEPGFHT
jgi:hypothetical protein